MFRITQEILYHLCSFLDGQSLFELTTVSHYFYNMLQDELIWKKRCQEEFGLIENKWESYSWQYIYYKSLYSRLNVLRESNDTWINAKNTEKNKTIRLISENAPPSSWTEITATADSIYALDSSKKLWIWEPQSCFTQPFRMLGKANERFVKISSYFENCIGLTEDNHLYNISELGLEMIYDQFQTQPRQIVSHPIYSVALTNEDKMYFIGNKRMGPRSMEKYYYKMVQQKFSKCSFFACNPILKEDPIDQLTSLDLYLLALTKSGRVYLLDISNLEEFSKNPKKHMSELVNFSGKSPRTIHSNCGQFTVCTKDGEVLMGDSDVEKDTDPVKLSFLQNQSVRSVSFGCAFPSYYQQNIGRTFGALTTEGKVITWKSIKGRTKINGDEDVQITSMNSLGSEHALSIAFGTQDSGSNSFCGNCFVALVVNE
ncbi:hypothetical protein BY458DRAFT_550073 [Sporodiniella umbellata]|nr:hypothetical protein BY458DRAFT_550073 [Sporodiniella umbellata]